MSLSNGFNYFLPLSNWLFKTKFSSAHIGRSTKDNVKSSRRGKKSVGRITFSKENLELSPELYKICNISISPKKKRGRIRGKRITPICRPWCIYAATPIPLLAGNDQHNQSKSVLVECNITFTIIIIKVHQQWSLPKSDATIVLQCDYASGRWFEIPFDIPK